MQRLSDKHLRGSVINSVRHALFILLTAALLTAGSCLIITGKAYSTQASSSTSIPGEYLVALPCEGYPGSLHDSRGIPKDVIYYTPCEGTEILRDPLLINYAFWLGITIVSVAIYKLARKQLK